MEPQEASQEMQPPLEESAAPAESFTLPTAQPVAEKTNWSGIADKLKVFAIKSAKILMLVAAVVVLVQLIYAGVLFYILTK